MKCILKETMGCFKTAWEDGRGGEELGNRALPGFRIPLWEGTPRFAAAAYSVSLQKAEGPSHTGARAGDVGVPVLSTPRAFRFVGNGVLISLVCIGESCQIYSWRTLQCIRV